MCPSTVLCNHMSRSTRCEGALQASEPAKVGLAKPQRPEVRRIPRVQQGVCNLHWLTGRHLVARQATS